VLAATVGPGLNFVGLVEPVRILLRLNEELEVGEQNMCEVLQCVCEELWHDLGEGYGVGAILADLSTIFTISYNLSRCSGLHISFDLLTSVYNSEQWDKF